MSLQRFIVSAAPALLGMYLPFCTADIRLTTLPPDRPQATLWQQPIDLEERDLLYGPWGRDNAPDPADTYTLVEVKHTGINPGLTVRDSEGRQWSVKQPFGEGDDEGPSEVVLSRVLSAVGYHQPPVYYLRSFTLRDNWGTHRETGGRFRLKTTTLKDRGEWSWQQNPFVGTTPSQGLLVVLLMFNSSDLKNSNNTVYEYRPDGDRRELWYVVRDIGTALGSTGRVTPVKSDPEAFERHGFIAGVRGGLVQFVYRGWHQELVRNRITTADVRWASDLLGGLSDRQWRDAFRAGGYSDPIAQRFIGELETRIAAGQLMAKDAALTP
jgi:hypothetical protein